MNVQKTHLWQKSMLLAEAVLILCNRLPREERYGIRARIIRAAVSVVSNIAEGWTRESRREKTHFLAIAQGSLAELNTQLLLCRRVGWLSPESLIEPGAHIDEVSRMLTVFRQRLRADIKK